MSRAIEIRVTGKDEDDHMCQGVVTGQVSNFILQSDALSVKITGAGIADLVNLVSTQAVDVVERTWTGSWAVPTAAAGQMLDFQFSGTVSDKYCAAHGASKDTDVSLDGYEGRFAVVKVDLDVDANYDGKIDDEDEPLEEDPGGLVCVGTNNLTRIELKVEPAGLPGKVTLSAEKGGGLIRVWANTNHTEQITLPKTWNAGAQPGALYIEGVANSAALRDVELKLEYDETPQGDNSGLFKCEDRVKLTVLKVDIVDPDENDVHLKGEEVKFDGELEPTGLSGVTYAWSVLEGTCDPATATAEDFQTTLKSDGTLKVKLAVTVGGTTTCEKIRTIKAMLPYPTYLNFKGTSNTRIRSIGTAPEWTKTDKTTKNYAVYDKQTTADVEARFEATEALTENTEVKVKASGNKESFAAANAYFHNWSWAEDELVLESSELYASINFYDTLDLTWKYIVRKLDGSWPDWSEAVTMGGDNPTTHIIYTVMKTPVKRDRSAGRGHDEYTQVYYDITCRKLEGYTGNDDDHVATEMMQWIADNLTWTGNCHYLAALLAAFNHTQGVTAYQYWLDHKPTVIGGGSGAVGDFECQRTIPIDPVPIGGGSQAYTFNFHSFNSINGSIYDPTTNTKKTGWTVQQYEDWLITKYAKCLSDYEKCYAMVEDPPDPDDPQYEWKDNVRGTMEPENYEHILWEVIP